ncbi:MAG: NnrU family protein [Hyphomicrobiaceae bacterium]
MTSLVVAALVWVTIHLLISGGPLRPWLAARLGERAYQATFAALSLASLMALYVSYIVVKPPTAAQTPLWLVVCVAAVQLLASLLIVAGLSTINPGTAGMDEAVRRPDVVRGMLRVTRHPFLWGVFLWSATHLALARDTAGLLLFGSIGLVALRGTWSIDRKRRLALGAAWRDFADRTSNVPFAAIIGRGQRLPSGEIGVIRLSAAVASWAAAIWAHPYLGAGTDLMSRLAPGYATP